MNTKLPPSNAVEITSKNFSQLCKEKRFVLLGDFKQIINIKNDTKND